MIAALSIAFAACLQASSNAPSDEEGISFSIPGSISEAFREDSPLKVDQDCPLPRSLWVSAEPRAEEEASFSIGPAGGYLSVRGADHGTWFVGAQARLHFARILAAEASITFHENHYEHDDVLVSQYPVQLTAFLYIIPEGPIRPYILGGVGWYYTRIDYRGAFSSIPNKTEHLFGGHLGAGAELFLAPKLSVDLDVRYILLNPTTEQVIHREFDYWQISFGLNFFF